MITDDEVDTYERDGVVLIRDVLDRTWVERMQAAVDRVIASPTDHGVTHGAFSHDLFLWRHDDDFRALAIDSPLPAIAARLMRTTSLRLFFDQLLVKEPGLRASIAWHQDLMTFPLTGEQVVSLWVPFDRATPDNGVVSYAKGSHRWDALFTDRNYADSVGDAEVPDPSTFDTLQWDVEPGDVVAHHPLTLHGSRGNRSDVRRRALSVRYAGDDIRFLARQPNFMTRAGLPLPDLADGAALDHELFPVLR